MIIDRHDGREVLQPCVLPDYELQLDPYIGCEHRCFYCYALNDAQTDWQQRIGIHENLVDRLGCQLDSLPPQTIYFGWFSDPYQPAEGKLRQTDAALQLLAERGFSASLLTKSDLLARDCELFASMPSSSVAISFAFNDDPTRELFEANTPSNERRIAALEQCRRAGLRTNALICPVMPLISDVAPLILSVRPYVDAVWVYGLQMESTDHANWHNMRQILADHYPDELPSIQEIAFDKEHSYWAQQRASLEQLRAELDVELRIEL